MLDGRHTGTGGGNHFVLGGATADDSPFLRRPDLLRSLLAYWHNHPALSYLFSRPVHRPDLAGAARRRSAQRFAVRARARVQAIPAAGPATSRRGSSIACSAICSSTSPATRIAPSSASTSCSRRTAPTGRLGLLEMRAFEMPPHARMSLTQQLLLRSLVARFWREPYRARAPGALGHRAARPLHAAVLRRAGFRTMCSPSRTRAGFPLKPEWFAPHFEFRFPKYGDFATLRRRSRAAPGARALACHGRGGRRRRRGALRGFLGRAPAGARSPASRPTATRSPATADAIPLRPTGTVGEFVAGVRYQRLAAAVGAASDYRRRMRR